MVNKKGQKDRQDRKARNWVNSSVRIDGKTALMHDFCNAMMTILGHVDLARKRIQSGMGDSLDHLDEIEAAARRAIDMCRKGGEPSSAVRTASDVQIVRPFVDDGPEISPADGRVLLVDDEGSVRAVARQMLERMGFQVESAVDGGDALEILAQNPRRFSCVVLDISMPGMSGEDCFAQIRGLRPDLPVLFSSGCSELSLVESLAEAPLTSFIQKPYSIASLRRVLHILLGASAPD